MPSLWGKEFLIFFGLVKYLLIALAVTSIGVVLLRLCIKLWNDNEPKPPKAA